MRFLFLFFILFTHLFAVVDVATVDFEESEEGFSGSLYGSLEQKRGSTDKNELEMGGRIQYDTKETVTWLQGEVERDESRGTKTDDNSFVHLRHIHQLYTPDWAAEFYIQEKQDVFKNIDSRVVYGAGGRYKFLNSKSLGKLFLGISLLDERIDYTEEDINPNEHNYRVGAYLSYKANINNNLEVSSIIYYQPELDNGSDYRLSSLSELTIHLTKVIDLSYLLQFDYDSDPAVSIPTTDTRQRLSFIYRFGKDDPFSQYASTFLQRAEDLEDVNSTAIVAVEVQTDIDDIKNSKDTLAGKWTRKDEVFNFDFKGTGSYLYDQGLYHQKFEWKVISTETQEGVQEAKDQSTKVVIIRYLDEEGRIGRIENYLWHGNKLVGLYNEQVKVFRR